MTDGAIRTAKADDTTDKFVSAHRGVEKFQQYTFFLGATHNLTDFVAASSQNDSGENLLRWVKVYVGDNPETLYTDSNLVYSRWDQDVDATDRNFHIQPADGATVTGDLVGFEVQTPSNALLRIEELAVYGTPVDGVDTLGAQLSDEYNAEAVSADLRMGFAVKAQGVAYQEDGIAGDYTNAKVVVDGKAYKLAKKDGQPLIGALMGVSSLVKDEELVLGTLNADVKTVYAANVYDIAEDGIVTFTARVTDIPNAYFDAEILGRAFVGYVDAKGVTRYIYGEQLSRSVNYFADNAGDVI